MFSRKVHFQFQNFVPLSREKTMPREPECKKKAPCPAAKVSLPLALPQPTPREADVRASWSASFHLEAALTLPGT